MKKILLTIVSVLGLQIAFAQIPLFNNEVEQQWQEVSYIVNKGKFCHEFRLITKGVAIERNGETFIPIIKHVGQEKDTVGFFRQDGQKYYYTQKNIGKEYLLYDFGLQEGDKVQICDELLQLAINDDMLNDDLSPETIEEYSTHTVEKIDVVTDKNGVGRKRIHLETGEYWIEGIGSPQGLTHSCVDGSGAGTQLLSYTEDGNIVLEFDCKCETLSIETENFSFVDDDMQWSYITVRNPEFQGPSYRITTLNKYSGDTIINGLQYKKMFKSEDNGETWSEIGYYRENEKIVYCIAKGESAEKVSYNFNIKPGLDEHFYIVVDSLTILEQKVPEYTFYWSETAPSEYTYAVGTIIDELGTVDWNIEAAMGITGGPEYSTTMLCVHKGNELLWHNPNYEECYYERTAINNTANQQIIISPNPVKDKLILTLPNANNEIKIFDLQGKLWLQQNVGSSAEINVSMLPTGTYVLVVNGESYKFVKE